MDNSEVYIKMSEKSPLQELWQPSAWDYIYCRIEKQVVVLSGYETDSGYYGHGIKCLECHGVSPKSWHYDHFCLFRQDQLQVMVKQQENIGAFVEVFYHFVCSLYTQQYPPTGSMEQLWHAFVVKELHQKIWNGEDWA